MGIIMELDMELEMELVMELVKQLVMGSCMRFIIGWFMCLVMGFVTLRVLVITLISCLNCLQV